MIVIVVLMILPLKKSVAIFTMMMNEVDAAFPMNTSNLTTSMMMIITIVGGLPYVPVSDSHPAPQHSPSQHPQNLTTWTHDP
jgi:hypothetical protein